MTLSKYNHLLAGAQTCLDTVNCVYFDDIESDISITFIMETVERVFTEYGEPPSQVNIDDLETGESIKMSYDRFRNGEFRCNRKTFAFAAKATNEVSQVWTPPAYAVFGRNGRVRFAGLYMPHPSDDGIFSDERLMCLTQELAAGATYRFEYPVEFSAVAYFNGLSYAPNSRRLGALTRQDELRVSNYSDNCWRGWRASDGFIRDVYEFLILNRKVVSRKVDGISLIDWVKVDDARGCITSQSGFFLWKPVEQNKNSIQNKLDAERVLLSGFSPDKNGRV